MMKKILFLVSFGIFMNFQATAACAHSEHDLRGFIDLDPSAFEDVAMASSSKVLEKELEEALTSISDTPNPTKHFEQAIQHQNQEYISSLGFSL